MVGHHPLWLPGVTGVVLDDDGRVLLGRRADTGEWAVPAGILEPGEQPVDGLLREITEETGITAEVERLVSVHSDDVVHYPNGDVCHFLSLVFRCRHVAGEARVADDESLEVGWFAVDALPPMTPRHRSRIDAALDPPAQPWL
ncbi:NUDIX hydrolase [Desertihabitans aurantiacus]|uniref:NUDIX hydrolase n=1 Tax=Desertihabitans aurantiacus TaxID=2282477 RepID=UPI0038B7A9F3